MKLRIGIDVGGTFTDVTAFDEDAAALVAVRKYTSNPAQPAAVMEDITRDLAAEFGADAVSLILHGSTAALNTMLEGKGVRVGLITTRGFRDVYEIGRQWRGDEVFNIFAPPPKMLLTRDRIHEVRERLDFTGNVIEPLDADDVAAAARTLIAQGVEAIAVCFLFAYANPAHEQAAAKIIRDIAPDLYVSLSHEVNPEWREYERTASTVANAYIGPPVSRYLRELEALSLRALPALARADDEVGRRRGKRPHAGATPDPDRDVRPGRRRHRRPPSRRHQGHRQHHHLRHRRHPLRHGGAAGPAAVQVGSVGGAPSAAHPHGRHRDHRRRRRQHRCGRSAACSRSGRRAPAPIPGPACYGRGGTEPTLTDALVVLGHLSPSALLDGAMPISSAKAHEAVATRVAAPLGLTPVEAAWGILPVLATNVTMAMRTITVERGYDPREFTLVPFGGMGPTIAGRIVAELGIGRILIPRDPGTFSAYGMLVTDVQQTRSFTRITRLDAAKPAELERIFADMEDSGAGGSDAGTICARAAVDVAQRRHALPRAVLRSQRSGRGTEQRRRSRGARKTLPRGAPAPLRPHGAVRSGRDRQFPGHRGRSDSQTAVRHDRGARECRNRRYRTKRARPISMQPTQSKCRCSAALRLQRAQSSTDLP